MAKCTVCSSDLTRPIWLGWDRCETCGSDSAPWGYDKQIYNELFAANLSYHRDHGALDADGQRREMTTNLERISNLPVPSLSFFDVGCAWGVSRLAKPLAGWCWHGWDIAKYAGQDESVVVQDELPEIPPVGVIMCREVIEHVPDVDDLLQNLRRLTLPGGWLQIQTPVPQASIDSALYEKQHLRLYSSEALVGTLWRNGWCVRGRLYWDRGQCVEARRV